MKTQGWAFILAGVGIVLLLAGDSVARIGNAVDSAINNKWFAIGLIVVGGGLILHERL